MSGERILFPWKPDDESGGGDGTLITLLAEKFIVADDTDNAYTVTGIPEGVESVHLNGVFLDPDYWTLSGTEISTTHAVDAGDDRRVGHGTNLIKNVVSPSVGTDAANKNYVDNGLGDKLDG